MAEGNRTAVNVHLVPIPAHVGEFLAVCQGLGGKGFVEFDEIHVVQRPACFGKHLGNGLGRGRENPFRLHRGVAVSHNAGQGLRADFLGIGLAGNHNGCRTVVQAGGVARGDNAIGLEGRAQFGKHLKRGVAARGFVGVHHRNLALAARDFQRHDFGLEFTGIHGSNGLLVAGIGKFVQFLTSNAKLLGDEFRRAAHMPVFEGAPEAVFEQGVGQLAVAVAQLAAPPPQQKGCVAHAFHATGHEKFAIARFHSLGSQHHSLEARAAHLVDGERPHGGRKPAKDGRLPRRVLAFPGSDDVAHHHLFDGGQVGQPGACDGFPHHSRAQFDGRQRRQRAAETPHGGAHGAQNHRNGVFVQRYAS